MKAWIKTAALLCLVCAWTGLAACDEENKQQSSSNGYTESIVSEESSVLESVTSSKTEESASETDSSSEADSSSDGEQEEEVKIDVDKALEKLLTETKSWRLEFEAEQRWRIVTEVEASIVKGSMILSESETGFNAKINLTERTIDTANGVDTTNDVEIYLIDGYSYLFQAGENTYIKEEADLEEVFANYGVSFEDLSVIVEEAVGILGDTETDSSGMLADLVKEFAEIEVEKDKISMVFDGKSDLDALIAYVYSVDQTTRIKDLIDEYLIQYNPVIDTEFILEQLGRLGKKTVADGVETAEQFLQDTFDTDLQTVKDAVIAIPVVREALLEQMSETKLQELEALQITQLVAEYGTITFDELAQAYTEDETVTFKSFFTELTEKLETFTIADFGEDAVNLLALLQTVVCEAFSGSYTLNFAEGDICQWSVSYNVSFGFALNKETINDNYSITASDFHVDSVEIVLPEGAKEAV